MKKQTAVEWLMEQVHSDEYTQAFGQTYISIILVEQALAMEKEQIIEAYENGEAEWTPFEFKTAQDYYTSIYGQ
jgi:hypothetical protein